MAQRHLHELLKEDQEPFQLKHYIADRRCQLQRLNNNNKSTSSKTTSKLQTVARNRKPITEITSTSKRTFTRHACFFTFQDSPDVRKSPLNFPSPVGKSPTRKVFLHIPASTSSLLLEAAMRIQKQQLPKSKTQINKVGFGLFGSFLKKLKDRNKNKKIKNRDKDEKTAETRTGHEQQTGLSCSCNNSRQSSAGWSESNEEEKSMDFETSSSCSRSDAEEIEELVNGGFRENKFCSSPLSPFRFNLQRCPSSTGRRTPDFSSPAASPIRHMKEDKENYDAIGSANIEEEEEEKEQCSPVSVLDPRFDDDEHEGEDEDEEDDDGDLECNYAIVQRAQQQLLYKLRRFERLAELDPIELEKLMLEEESNGDLEELDECQDDDDSVLSHRDRDFNTFASELTIPFDMKRLVSDLITEEKTETNSLNSREVVFGRVCKRLDSWQHVRSDTIDMMVESDLKTEFDDWKMCQEQREETGRDIELSIFRLLVEELAEELVHLAGHHGNPIEVLV